MSSIPILGHLLRFYRRLYDFLIGLADKRWAEPGLWGLSFAEASFFPIPIDPLLMAMGAARPSRAIRYAIGVTFFSVAGGAFGWVIGTFMMDSIGNHLVELWGLEEHWTKVEALYQEHGALILFTAALTPIPYIAFTLAGGAFGQDLSIFLLAATVGRGLRFGSEGVLLRLFGAPILVWVEKWFDRVAILFTLLLILVVYFLKVH
ncbi:MAG: DedA family protein [Planctomycetota bacterium]|jgi:membrane protein YqaA with SNARE-associated domain|nr:DedA family protein [Planctomycetota bacterium]